MNNEYQLEIQELIDAKLVRLSSEIVSYKRKAIIVSILACLPFVIAALIAFIFISRTTHGVIAFVLAVSAVGLTITIGVFGSGYRDSLNRCTEEVERLETIKMCLTAIPFDELDKAELLQLLTSKNNDQYAFAPLAKGSMPSIQTDPEYHNQRSEQAVASSTCYPRPDTKLTDS